MRDLLKDEFSAAMGRFGPFPPKPRLAAGVSGGADSTALVLLAQAWAASRGGSIQALIVDHGLRRQSAEEANLTKQRLKARGIEGRVITLSGLGHPKLQETARGARHAALATATREANSLYLLLGHQAADQAETVAMRAKRGDRGLEGIADWTARNDSVLLRPLLTVAPLRLREFLRQENMPWVEDPSNDDQQFERVRVRRSRIEVLPRNPRQRQAAETDLAMFLARHAIIRPEGFAVLLADIVPPAALGALLRTIGGVQYAPRQEAVTEIAARLKSTTLGGVRIMKAGEGTCGLRAPSPRHTRFHLGRPLPSR
jgi:tRNA(Ile)-lysidine synthase